MPPEAPSETTTIAAGPGERTTTKVQVVQSTAHSRIDIRPPMFTRQPPCIVGISTWSMLR